MKKKKFKAVELSCLDEDTILNIRKWRNQDFVREQMFNRDIISLETHLKWIEDLKRDRNRYLFVFYLDDEPFAVEQYEYDDDRDSVKTGTYLISDEFQALGYGVFMEYFGTDIVYEHLHYNNIYGEIAASNKRCISLNRFSDGTVEEKLIDVDGNSHPAVVISSSKELWLQSEKAKLQKLVLRFVYEDYEVVIK